MADGVIDAHSGVVEERRAIVNGENENEPSDSQGNPLDRELRT